MLGSVCDFDLGGVGAFFFFCLSKEEYESSSNLSENGLPSSSSLESSNGFVETLPLSASVSRCSLNGLRSSGCSVVGLV